MSDTTNQLREFEQEAQKLIARSKAAGEQSLNVYVEQLRFLGEEQRRLAEKASQVRKDTVGNLLIVRASLVISNFCRQKCSFCGMTKDNQTLSRYRMTVDNVRQVVDEAARLGIRNLHLASGEDWHFPVKDICDIVSYGVSLGMEVTLVTGHRSLGDYQAFRHAGAARYILKVETTNETLFREARTGTDRNGNYLRSSGTGREGPRLRSGLPEDTGTGHGQREPVSAESGKPIPGASGGLPGPYLELHFPAETGVAGNPAAQDPFRHHVGPPPGRRAAPWSERHLVSYHPRGARRTVLRRPCS